MSKTYIVADANFCDSATAEQCNMSIQEYNNTLIKRINETVNADDTILFLGRIGVYEYKKDVKDCINALKAKTKKCIDMRLQPDFNTREKLSEIGVERGYTIDGFIKDVVYDCNYFITITSDYEYYRKLVGQTSPDEYEHYYAMPASAYNFRKKLENNCFNISIGQWNLYPIDYSLLPEMIDNEKVFEKMEDSEYESDI